MTAILLAALLLAPRELVDDPAVLNFCRLLVHKASAERFREQGAFIARTSDGVLYFVVWPASDEARMMRWHGRFPDGTMAIVHTHPPHLPEPSPLDRRTARVARIPIYVLTPSGVQMTTGAGPVIILDRQWMQRSAR